MGMDNAIVELKKLMASATYEKKKQYNAAERHSKWHNSLQQAVIIIGIFNGSALITLLKLGAVGVAYASAGLSLFSAILSSIQKACKFDQVAERNREVGDQFLLLIKEINMAIALYKDTGDQCRFDAACAGLTKRYGEIVDMAKRAPTSKKDYILARKGIEDGEENYSAADMRIGQ